MSGPRPRHALLDPFRVVQGRAAMVIGPDNAGPGATGPHGSHRRADCTCLRLDELCPACREASS